jgi:hypothetical protein
MDSQEFKQLIEGLHYKTDLEKPTPKYRSGLAFVAYNLWKAMLSGGPTSRILAIKEILAKSFNKEPDMSDMCNGQQVKSVKELFDTCDMKQLTEEEVEMLSSILDKILPND